MRNTPIRALRRSGGNAQLLRARGSYFYSFTAYLICAGMAYAVLVDVETMTLRAMSPILFILLVVQAVYRVMQRPFILFTDSAVVVRNPFSTTLLDWYDVQEIRTKYALTFVSEHGTTRCWSAVGPSRQQHRSIHPSELRGFHQGEREIKVADSPRTDSGTGAYIANMRRTDRGQSSSDKTPYQRSIDKFGITVLAATFLTWILSFNHF